MARRAHASARFCETAFGFRVRDGIRASLPRGHIIPVRLLPQVPGRGGLTRCMRRGGDGVVLVVPAVIEH